MRRKGIASGLLVAGGVLLLLVPALLTAKKAPDEDVPASLRPALRANRNVMVTYLVPSGVDNSQALSALHSLVTWGTPLSVVFAPDAKGRKTAVLSARTLKELPSGPPPIATSHGTLVPYVWDEIPEGSLRS